MVNTWAIVPPKGRDDVSKVLGHGHQSMKRDLYTHYINGHFRILDWRYLPYIYKDYFSGLNFREYPHKIWPEIWY